MAGFSDIYALLYKKSYIRVIDDSINYLSPFIKPSSKVLDVGSGPGWYAERTSHRLKVNVTCIDITDKNKTSLKIILFDGKKIPFKNSYFDVTLLIYVLHHCDNWEQILDEAIRVTKPGGKIIIQEDIPQGLINKLLTKFHILHYNLQYGIWSRGYFRNSKYWKEIFAKRGLKILSKKKLKNLWSYPVQTNQFILETQVI